MKEFLAGLIKSHLIVLNSLIKRFKKEGGDISTLDNTCPDGYYYDEELKKCMPDVGDGDDPNGK